MYKHSLHKICSWYQQWIQGVWTVVPSLATLGNAKNCIYCYEKTQILAFLHFKIWNSLQLLEGCTYHTLCFRYLLHHFKNPRFKINYIKLLYIATCYRYHFCTLKITYLVASLQAVPQATSFRDSLLWSPRSTPSCIQIWKNICQT